MPSRLPYLPALDGLRAIAVLMVVAYHLEFSWAAGGFLGVDVFFVISGYLITRLLLDEHADHGRIGMVNFWTRRFKRLVPAMVAMIAATLLATRQWGLAEQWRSVRIDALSAIGYVANWRFVLDEQSYFEASLGPSPLRHTWSLAVEEQWYLLWPIAMIGLCVWINRRPGPRERTARVVAIVVAAAVASAVLMAVLFDPSDPSRVYFGTDTRAQQLLVGAALAWLLHAAPRIGVVVSSSRLRVPFVVALALLLAVAVFAQDDSAWLYRGGLLVVSVLAAVVVLGTTTSTSAAAGTGLAWLGAAPLVWIGRRSYGIYLWHWPVIIFIDPATGGELGRWSLVTLTVVVTLALTELSHRLIETPVRRSTAPPVRTVVAWSVGALAVGLVGLVWLVPPPSRDLQRSDASFPELDELATPSVSPAQDRVTGSTTVPPTESFESDGNTTEPRRLLLFGDSAAFTLAEQFEAPAGTNWDVQAFAEFGCPITPGMTIDAGSSEPNPVDAECDGWVGLWPEYARILQPDVVVVMIGAWVVLDHRIDGTDRRFPSDAWRDTVREAIDDAATAAATTEVPVVFLDVPCMGANPGTTGRADPERVTAVNELIREVAAERDDMSVEALSSVICPNGNAELTIDGIPARYDGVHYTRPGAAVVWPWLFDVLDRQLDGELDR